MIAAAGGQLDAADEAADVAGFDVGADDLGLAGAGDDGVAGGLERRQLSPDSTCTHFALTALLFERLAQRTEARVVTVTSGFAKRGRLDLANLDGSRGYSTGRAYIQSKLANLLFGAELDRRLRARPGATVKSVLAHPGVAATAMQQKPTGLMGVVARAISAWLARPAADGALPVVHAAVGPTVESGELWGPGKRLGAPPLKETWRTLDDRDGAAQLWARTESLAQVRFLAS